jgi:hypothetical protein
MIARQEHHHELGRRVKLVPVGLSTKSGYVIPHEFGERLQFDLALVFIVERDGVDVTRHRGLRVDDDRLGGRAAFTTTSGRSMPSSESTFSCSTKSQ